MTDPINTGDAPQINIIPVDTHGDILVQLIRGQERAATALELQNRRLWGGDGQLGSIPALFELQHKLADKLDINKDELVNKIAQAKADLSAEMTVDKTAMDHDIETLEDKHNALDKKVNWYAGGIAALGTAATLIMSYIGLRSRAGH